MVRARHRAVRSIGGCRRCEVEALPAYRRRRGRLQAWVHTWRGTGPRAVPGRRSATRSPCCRRPRRWSGSPPRPCSTWPPTASCTPSCGCARAARRAPAGLRAVEAVTAGLPPGRRWPWPTVGGDQHVADLLRHAHRPTGRWRSPGSSTGCGGPRPARSSRSTWPGPRPASRPACTPRRCDIARERHLNVTIHASEPPDLELIDDALAHGAHRIGHGVRLVDDTHGRPRRAEAAPRAAGPLRAATARSTSSWLRRATSRSAPCPASPTIPIAPFLRAGFSVGVNTDNRLMSDVCRRPSCRRGRRLRPVLAEVERLTVERRRGRLRALRGAPPDRRRHRPPAYAALAPPVLRSLAPH